LAAPTVAPLMVRTTLARAEQPDPVLDNRPPGSLDGWLRRMTRPGCVGTVDEVVGAGDGGGTVVTDDGAVEAVVVPVGIGVVDAVTKVVGVTARVVGGVGVVVVGRVVVVVLVVGVCRVVVVGIVVVVVRRPFKVVVVVGTPTWATALSGGQTAKAMTPAPTRTTARTVATAFRRARSCLGRSV
jgi:hypothetical protein